MEFLFFRGPRIGVAPAEHAGEPNPYVNPKLPEHHDTNGSITRLTASTIRRQFEILRVTCLRPRGVSL